MSYEYKEEILLDIGPEPNCNYESESNRYYDKIDELDHVYAQAAKADEYEAKNKELLEYSEYLIEEIEYLRKVNDDLLWQRDTDEEHEAKAKAWDKYKTHMESHIAGEVNEEEFVSDLKSDYFESGEYDAKK